MNLVSPAPRRAVFVAPMNAQQGDESLHTLGLLLRKFVDCHWDAHVVGPKESPFSFNDEESNFHYYGVGLDSDDGNELVGDPAYIDSVHRAVVDTLVKIYDRDVPIAFANNHAGLFGMSCMHHARMDDVAISTIYEYPQTHEEYALYGTYADQAIVAVSPHIAKEISRHTDGSNIVGIIPFGVPVTKCPYSESSGRCPYLAYVGEISPDQGVKEAILVAQYLQMKLRVVGTALHPTGDYVDEVKQLIDDSKYVSFEEDFDYGVMPEFLCNAKALIRPALHHEPSAYMCLQSAAAGTPVVVTSDGAPSYFVGDSHAGAVVRHYGHQERFIRSFGEAVRLAIKIPRTACRRWVENNATSAHMFERYAAAFKQIAERQYQRNVCAIDDLGL